MEIEIQEVLEIERIVDEVRNLVAGAQILGFVEDEEDPYFGTYHLRVAKNEVKAVDTLANKLRAYGYQEVESDIPSVHVFINLGAVIMIDSSPSINTTENTYSIFVDYVPEAADTDSSNWTDDFGVDQDIDDEAEADATDD